EGEACTYGTATSGEGLALFFLTKARRALHSGSVVRLIFPCAKTCPPRPAGPEGPAGTLSSRQGGGSC
ncbi:hypothetical protein A2U01_0069430, partial [Trifolium medium]|nr:hypothetical protein [Trifolium medium]